MMRTVLLFVLSALLLPVISASVSAQDAPPNPEGGDIEEVAPGAEPEADASAAPREEAPVVDGKKLISVALLVGYGVSLEDSNPWGLGFGARGGYNLDKIYLGARFVFYLGESVTAANPLGGAAFDTSVNIWELGVEAGYDVELSSSVTLRPELGIGLANSSSSFNGFPTSSTDLFLAPGASLLFDVTPDIYLGIDVRFQLILAGTTAKGIPLLATGGMRF